MCRYYARCAALPLRPVLDGRTARAVGSHLSGGESMESNGLMCAVECGMQTVGTTVREARERANATRKPPRTDYTLYHTKAPHTTPPRDIYITALNDDTLIARPHGASVAHVRSTSSRRTSTSAATLTTSTQRVTLRQDTGAPDLAQERQARGSSTTATKRSHTPPAPYTRG